MYREGGRRCCDAPLNEHDYLRAAGRICLSMTLRYSTWHRQALIADQSKAGSNLFAKGTPQKQVLEESGLEKVTERCMCFGGGTVAIG